MAASKTEPTVSGDDAVEDALEGLHLDDGRGDGDAGETLQALVGRQQSRDAGGDQAEAGESPAASTLAETLIAHMPTTDTQPGRLPPFSSWSLVQLGSSYLYHHSAGVNQPGFAPSSKHLLAWDVPLKKATLGMLAEKWPNLAEIAVKRAPDVLDKRKEIFAIAISRSTLFLPFQQGALVNITVKVFVGMEYECPRGHRIMASAPDRVMKQTSNPNRDASSAAKIVATDMPLYMACPCRYVS